MYIKYIIHIKLTQNVTFNDTRLYLIMTSIIMPKNIEHFDHSS